MIPPRPHLLAAAIATDNYPFAWDAWEADEYFMTDDGQDDRLERLTLKARLGLLIASAEWVVHRFSASGQHLRAAQYLEAAWAGAVHPAYCAWVDLEEGDWAGPVLGPMRSAITLVNEGLHDLGTQPDPGRQAVWMRNLVRHVVGNTAAFDRWWSACIERLLLVHAIDVELAGQKPDLFENFPTMGAPVPQAAYDPSTPYVPAHNAAEWDRYLQGLDASTNPFLTPPEELPDDGRLPGPPYRYLPGQTP